MQRLDVLEAMKTEVSEESRIAVLQSMVEGQIRSLERLLESNSGYVKDPGAWNVVAGYMDQLRFWAPRIFYGVDTNLDWFEKSEGAPPHPLIELP